MTSTLTVSGRTGRLALTLVATLGLTLAALVTPAQAAAEPAGADIAMAPHAEASDIVPLATATCIVVGASCTSAAVRAHSTGFFVRYYVNGFGCSWRVRDINSWRVVKSGTAWPTTTGIVEGLHGWYQLEMGPVCLPGHNGLLRDY
nr:hypothetical protein [Micromonospora sp. DSM 115978]